MLDRKRVCGNCQFADLQRHLCRYGPPVVSATLETVWPSVRLATDWCGRFRYRDEIVAEAARLYQEKHYGENSES